MNKKTTGIIAYITWIGWIVAFCAGDKEGAKFHLNQALVILIGQIVAAVINYIPYVGGIVGTILSIFLFVCWLMGLIYACQEQEKEVPLIGQIKITAFSFLPNNLLKKPRFFGFACCGIAESLLLSVLFCSTILGTSARLVH